MGEDSRGIEASSSGGVSDNYDLGSCEAHVVSGGTQENRGGAAGTVGEGEGGAEEDGLGLNRGLRFSGQV
jgi:hypothetical protein